MQHLIQRDQIHDHFSLPSVALCGLIYFPKVKDGEDKCSKCLDRLQEIQHVFA